jgi:CheY-like chemotaxis protein
MFDLYVRVMNITKTLPRKETYTTDLGHGLDGPAGSFEYITWHTRALMESNKAEPLDATIMIVDDQMPEAWYQRMIYVGFKDIPKQQGFFYDCESALVALEHGKYDIILTDLELGEGRMGGVEFIEKAYALQKSQGMQPRISAFSYNKEKLEEAEERLGWISGGESKIMGQVSNNDKGGFKAINFRMDVRNSLR